MRIYYVFLLCQCMKIKLSPPQEVIRKIDQLEISWHETEDEEERDRIWEAVRKLEVELVKLCNEKK